MATISHENLGRLIGLAGELVKEIKPGRATPEYGAKLLDLRIQAFDKAPKSLGKTVVDLEAKEE